MYKMKFDLGVLYKWIMSFIENFRSFLYGLWFLNMVVWILKKVYFEFYVVEMSLIGGI